MKSTKLWAKLNYCDTRVKESKTPHERIKWLKKRYKVMKRYTEEI